MDDVNNISIMLCEDEPLVDTIEVEHGLLVNTGEPSVRYNTRWKSRARLPKVFNPSELNTRTSSKKRPSFVMMGDDLELSNTKNLKKFKLLTKDQQSGKELAEAAKQPCREK